MRIRHTYLTAMLAAASAARRPLLPPHHRLRPTVLRAAGSQYARRVIPGQQQDTPPGCYSLCPFAL